MKDELTLVALLLFIGLLLVWINIYPPMETVQINCAQPDPQWPDAVREACRVKGLK
jgi:hypothetical protein